MVWILRKTIKQPRTLATWLKDHYQFVWWVCVILSTWPAIQLYLNHINNNLGANPLQKLQQESGRLALTFLIITLSVTPLRRLITHSYQYAQARLGKRLSDWNWIIRLRKILGLYTFYYASLHVLIWLHLDFAYDWPWLLTEIFEKPYLAVGSITFLLIIPLALTTPTSMMKKLGRNWRRLHRTIYLIAVLSLIHYWLSLKPGLVPHWLFIIAVFILLGYRVISHYGWLIKKPLDNGMEMPER
jgi:sulfoxide reductase heme-binding subunit YedZ